MVKLILTLILCLIAILVPLYYEKKMCKKKTDQLAERQKKINDTLLREGLRNEEEKKENSR